MGAPGGASRRPRFLAVRLTLPLRRPSLASAFLALALVAGCIGLPGAKPAADGGSPGAAGGALATEAIAVTPLDGPPVAAPATPPKAETPPAAVPTAPETPAAGADGQAGATTPDTAEAAPAAEAPPPPPKSPEQLSCERKGGTWATAGGSGAKSCVRRTRDSGKACSNGRQCEGDCLARSRTCSPIMPLFGCNEILQDNGARVNQCIE